MTVHCSKGLEFKYVFVLDFNMGYFPGELTSDLNEEGRLAYVAFTRAKDELYVASSKETDLSVLLLDLTRITMKD